MVYMTDLTQIRVTRKQKEYLQDQMDAVDNCIWRVVEKVIDKAMRCDEYERAMTNDMR
jgi:hypothetical protein